MHYLLIAHFDRLESGQFLVLAGRLERLAEQVGALHAGRPLAPQRRCRRCRVVGECVALRLVLRHQLLDSRRLRLEAAEHRQPDEQEALGEAPVDAQAPKEHLERCGGRDTADVVGDRVVGRHVQRVGDLQLAAHEARRRLLGGRQRRQHAEPRRVLAVDAEELAVDAPEADRRVRRARQHVVTPVDVTQAGDGPQVRAVAVEYRRVAARARQLLVGAGQDVFAQNVKLLLDQLRLLEEVKLVAVGRFERVGLRALHHRPAHAVGGDVPDAHVAVRVARHQVGVLLVRAHGAHPFVELARAGELPVQHAVPAVDAPEVQPAAPPDRHQCRHLANEGPGLEEEDLVDDDAVLRRHAFELGRLHALVVVFRRHVLADAVRHRRPLGVWSVGGRRLDQLVGRLLLV